jgi:hypothetical protein
MSFGEQKSGRLNSWFGLTQPFDQEYRTVTSSIVQPWVLFLIRLTLAIYSVIASIVHLAITEEEAYDGIK